MQKLILQNLSNFFLAVYILFNILAQNDIFFVLIKVIN
jgi:hypothetical protein